MNGEQLLEKMELVSPAFVEDADRMPRTRRGRMKYAAAAASLALLLAAGIPLLRGRGTEERYPVKHVPAAETGTGEMMLVPRWEDMPDPRRYGELRVGDRVYRTCMTRMEDGDLGASLGTAEGVGYDAYADEERTCSVSVYAIRGIGEDAAVCVQFRSAEGNIRTYAYANADYIPGTLGEFLTALDTETRMTTGLVYDWRDGAEPVVYEDVPASLVRELLLSEPEIPNEPGQTVGDTVMEIAVRLDVLGSRYKTLSLTEDGYLFTNLLETGKYFRIGTERVQAFVSAVREGYQGYFYRYDVPTQGDGEPE